MLVLWKDSKSKKSSKRKFPAKIVKISALTLVFSILKLSIFCACVSKSLLYRCLIREYPFYYLKLDLYILCQIISYFITFYY